MLDRIKILDPWGGVGSSSGGIPFLRLLVPGSDVKNPFKEKNSIILLYRVVVFAISGNLEFLYLKKYPRIL